ncbi:MAG: hypothetical protein PHD32_02005 [Eubacteriales bacterium]|nr:hypothetical protein [Eubacteriales bacterium]
MGKGRGGYDSKQVKDTNSRGRKVKDQNSVFVAERYIDQGKVVVFRAERQGKMFDLSIKDIGDSKIERNIEVKGVISDRPSQTAEDIAKGFTQVPEGETAARYDPNRTKTEAIKLAEAGFAEALRKHTVKGTVEVWFRDKTMIRMN